MKFLVEILIQPFWEYAFLKRAFVACLALSFGCAPLGVLLVLRRLSLMGDALSHSILPGVAFGYIVGGLSLPLMGIGGALAGLIVASLATFVTRYTSMKEDASFVGFYLIALALGAILVSLKGNAIDLMHILFGDILSINRLNLIVITTISSVSLLTISMIYRPLLIECFDPLSLKLARGKGGWFHVLFMVLVVFNMVSAFQALGTLLSLGLMMLPAVASRFWVQKIHHMFILSCLIAIVSSYLGLLLSYHFVWPSGPAITLIAGIFYILSLAFGHHDSLMQAWKKRR